LKNTSGVNIIVEKGREIEVEALTSSSILSRDAIVNLTVELKLMTRRDILDKILLLKSKQMSNKK